MAYSFSERTLKVTIERSSCPKCRSKACVKACSLYDRGILVLRGGIPTLREGTNPEREGTECLACEEECRLRGFSSITIEAPIQGLDEYRRKAAGG